MNKRKKNFKDNPVTVVIPMRNASTTVEETLRTIVNQDYSISEIIVVDNVSKDNSIEIVKKFEKKSKIKIKLLVQKKDKGVSSSYNWGVRESKTQLVVFLTSDCSLPTNKELRKLVEPLIKNSAVVATYATCVLPGFIWKTYNFWEKFFSARMVNNKSSEMVLKFDCIRRNAFLSIGGFDDVQFGGDAVIGGEDADLSVRFRKIGQIVRSKARAYHLHYRGVDYKLSSMARSRKMYARSQGRFLRKYGLSEKDAWIAFLTRPILAVSSVLIIGIPFLIVYSFLYTSKMFVTKETVLNPRILLVPFLNIYFLYYELYWVLSAFLFYKKQV